MSATNDGGPAFPSRFEVIAGSMDPIKGCIVDSTQVYISMGMSLRDWFAGQAINSMIMTARTERHLIASADAAYALADAMIAARETRK